MDETSPVRTLQIRTEKREKCVRFFDVAAERRCACFNWLQEGFRLQRALEKDIAVRDDMGDAMPFTILEDDTAGFEKAGRQLL